MKLENIKEHWARPTLKRFLEAKAVIANVAGIHRVAPTNFGQRHAQCAGDFSEDYATSMALIILQMPNRYLPVYTGKGPGS